MPIVTPIVPRNITVHLGSPNSYAQNVTVPFVEYIKNVASSEIYPTWDDDALKANILAQISFALNRVYIEYYRAQGKDFDITNDTSIDQKYIYGRTIFKNVAKIVDGIFNDYIRRKGFVEPLAAKYCNGTTVTCKGLSQWGSEYMARDGFSYLDILYSYYGYDIELVKDAPIKDLKESYPGYPIALLSRGRNVVVIQTSLNRISNDYPQIPKVKVDGIFGQETRRSVMEFQRIFNLTVDGIVGRATWYKLVRIYTGLLRLSELNSYGQTLYGFSVPYYDTRPVFNLKSNGKEKENEIDIKDSNDVFLLQYFLNSISAYNPYVLSVENTGVFDKKTENSIKSFQAFFDLEITGKPNRNTWNLIYDNFLGIEKQMYKTSMVLDVKIEPYTRKMKLDDTGKDVIFLQEELNFVYVSYGTAKAVLVTGIFDQDTKDSVEKFQESEGLKVTGEVDFDTYKILLTRYVDALSSIYTSKHQFQGDLKWGDQDTKYGVQNSGGDL